MTGLVLLSLGAARRFPLGKAHSIIETVIQTDLIITVHLGHLTGFMEGGLRLVMSMTDIPGNRCRRN